MRAKTKSQAHLGCLVLNVALGAEASNVQRRIEAYLNFNGPEWTCARIKAVRQVALLLKSGEREKALEVLQSNSIAYHTATLVPKGPEGILVRHYLLAQRPSAIKRADAAMRFYTALRLGEASKKQVKKAYEAISGYCTAWDFPSEIESFGFNVTRNALKARRFHVKSLKEDPIGNEERHAEHLKATSHYYSRARLPHRMRKHRRPPTEGERSEGIREVVVPEVPYATMCLSMMTEPWLPAQIDHMVPCYEMREEIRNSEWSKENPQLYAGKITVLQEPGCKARVVCQPSAWLQLGFMPLHHRLARLASDMFPKEDCVTNQVKGAYSILDHMARGQTVFCTDLSSATDRFPRWFSEGVLKAIGYTPYAEALEDVCNRTFACDFSPTGEIKYATGQPMGLYGSFPLFHLSNLLVADHVVRERLLLCESPGKKYEYDPVSKSYPAVGSFMIPFGDGSYFKVLGDDIVFSDGAVAEAYRREMARLGVQISETKSFSGKVAEFAGFIAVQGTKYQTAYRPYKVPVGDVISNPIQFLDSIGAGFRNAPSKVRPYWERRWKEYLLTAGSRDLALDPLVPGDVYPSKDTYRGDNRTMVSLAQALRLELGSILPDLSGSTRINSDPLFLEQRPFDYYGFNPDLLVREEKTSKVEAFRRPSTRIAQDPLIREVRKGESTRLVRNPKPQAANCGPSASLHLLVEAEYLAGLNSVEDELDSP